MSVYKIISWLHPDDGAAVKSLAAKGRHLTDLAVAGGVLDVEGRLSFPHCSSFGGDGRERWQRHLAPGARIFPHVTNADKTAGGVGELLGSASRRRRTAENLLDLARSGGWSGISLDISGPAPGERDNLSALVEEAAWMLHGAELELIVTAQARTMDPAGGGAGVPAPRLWADLYDYQTLGIYADSFVMGTWQIPGGFRPDDRPDGDGTLARPRAAAAWGWLNTCLEYAMDTIPPRSLVLGLPFYGLKWRREGGRWRCLGPVAPADVPAAADGEEELYYDDEESLARRIALVKEHHLAGAGFWRLGMEAPGVWRAVDDLAV